MCCTAGEQSSAKAVVFELHVEPESSPVHGVVSERNHVWLNRIDNAIDAGPGIDDDDLARAFDPFVTTKDVGRGAGLGLDVVQSSCAATRAPST